MTWTDRLTPREFAGLVDAGRIGRDGGPYSPAPLYAPPGTYRIAGPPMPGSAPKPPALSCSSCRALPVRVTWIPEARIFRCAWCGNQQSTADARGTP